MSSPSGPLLDRLRALRRTASTDPFSNPVLSMALAIGRMMDGGGLDPADLAAVVTDLRDRAFDDRASRLRAVEVDADAAFATLAARLARPDPADSPVPWAVFRDAAERPRAAAVFTAHPTFGVTPGAYAALASGGPSPAGSHRPTPPTLAEEFSQAVAAIERGRDAGDRLAAALLAQARGIWADRWTSLDPAPVLLASWVGYDTDGRTDIQWSDTLRLRLTMKMLQLQRIAVQCATVPGGQSVADRAGRAADAVATQIAVCPAGSDPAGTAAFAQALVSTREGALVSAAPVLALFPAALAAAPDDHARLALCVARAGLAAHRLSLAHTHVRLNAAQIHNAIRPRLGLDDPPADPARRRRLLAAINAALEEGQTVPVDFGALLAEPSSAARLMMTVAQIVKHVDADAPIRFLIAETETGYTLLAALWLAQRFGCAAGIELSPLFETADALEAGPRVIEEALRSPVFRAHLRAQGRLCLQFGYSDSGRYVGQTASSYLIERLKLRLADLLGRHGLQGIQVVCFDTHGESLGRGGHPGGLALRFAWLSPPAVHAAFARAGNPIRTESSFQGGDGYLYFGTPRLAESTIAAIATHAFRADDTPDPAYTEPDFAADVFATVREAVTHLVEDHGYAALLSAFGPALLDRTGSRPAARQTELGGPARIRHPRELRAIPNNAILLQLGWLANLLHGVGAAAARQPDAFAEMRARSPRFAAAMAMVSRAAELSDTDVLRAIVAMLDPATWLDRAAHATIPGRREALLDVSHALEANDLSAPLRALARRFRADEVALRAAWPDLPTMPDRTMLLHALRLAIIQRIWLVGASIPDFSPRHGTTRADLMAMLLRLEVPGAIALLRQVFPPSSDPTGGHDFAEPPGPRAADGYLREQQEIAQPLERLFALVREISIAITHEAGAFG